MSFEALEKNWCKKSDVYSFGMMMIEVLTGCIPWNETTNLFKISENVKNGKYPQILKQISKHWRILIINCCKKRLEKWLHKKPRYSIGQVMTFLKKYKKELITELVSPNNKIFGSCSSPVNGNRNHVKIVNDPLGDLKNLDPELVKKIEDYCKVAQKDKDIGNMLAPIDRLKIIKEVIRREEMKKLKKEKTKLKNEQKRLEKNKKEFERKRSSFSIKEQMDKEIKEEQKKRSSLKKSSSGFSLRGIFGGSSGTKKGKGNRNKKKKGKGKPKKRGGKKETKTEDGGPAPPPPLPDFSKVKNRPKISTKEDVDRGDLFAEINRGKFKLNKVKKKDMRRPSTPKSMKTGGGLRPSGTNNDLMSMLKFAINKRKEKMKGTTPKTDHDEDDNDVDVNDDDTESDNDESSKWTEREEEGKK
jgi:hypothetical protein